MAKVFVSHASEDLGFAEEVHAWLVDDGHEVFLDRDLRDGIGVGEDWEQRLYERLRWADAVVCVVTSAYVASQWCTAEVAIARSRGSRLLPVLAESGVTHPLLKSFQYADATRNGSAARARLAEALRRVDQTGGLGWPDERSPFPGLRPFDTDERMVFFGRGDEVARLAALLRSPAERVEASALLVVGPSGCGKSSLVRAGLIPAMAAEPDWWTVAGVRAGRRSGRGAGAGTGGRVLRTLICTGPWARCAAGSTRRASDRWPTSCWWLPAAGGCWWSWTSSRSC